VSTTKKENVFIFVGVIDNIQESDGNNHIDIFVNHEAKIFILMQLGLISHQFLPLGGSMVLRYILLLFFIKNSQKC
jgi:hypothetical protein